MTQSELLGRLETDLRNILDIIRTKIATLPEEALKVRTHQEHWNMLECFAHINIFNDMYLSRIDMAIHKGKARKWTPTPKVRYTMMGLNDIRRANPYNNKKFRTHKRYNFIHQPLSAEVVKTTIIHCERLLRSIQASKEIDLNKPMVKRGKSGFFKYTLGNILEWLVAHTQRHVDQATRISF